MRGREAELAAAVGVEQVGARARPGPRARCAAPAGPRRRRGASPSAPGMVPSSTMVIDGRGDGLAELAHEEGRARGRARAPPPRPRCAGPGWPPSPGRRSRAPPRSSPAGPRAGAARAAPRCARSPPATSSRARLRVTWYQPSRCISPFSVATGRGREAERRGRVLAREAVARRVGVARATVARSRRPRSS